MEMDTLYSRPLLFPLPSGFKLWNWVSSVMRHREEKALICARRFRFFRGRFLLAPALFSRFALASAKAGKCVKSAGAHLCLSLRRCQLHTTVKCVTFSRKTYNKQLKQK
jgi:hypothetical protein